MLKKNITLFIFLFFTFVHTANSQPTDNYLFSGKLLDADSKDPLMYANISIVNGKQNLFGTISDLDGNFKIILSKSAKEIKKTKIIFSYTGYKSQLIKTKKIIKDMPAGNLIIYLHKGNGLDTNNQAKIGRKKITSRDNTRSVK
jgi:hypothetical protein